MKRAISTALRSMRDLMLEKPARIIGFSLCLVWVFVASHSLSISISFAFANGLSARILLLAGTSVGALAAYVLQKRGLGQGTVAIAIATLCMSAGFLLYAFPNEMEVPGQVSLCCVLASGVGYGFLFLSWLTLLEENRAAQSLTAFGLAILLASAFDFVALAVPQYVLLALMPCLPIASALLYTREAQSTQRPSAPQRGSSWKDKSLRQKAVVLFLIPLAVEGFAYGSFLQLTFDLSSSLENEVGMVALALAAALLLLVSVLYAKLERSAPLFVLFSLLAFGYSLIPLFLKDVRVIIFILMLGYNFFYFFALALSAEMRRAANLSLLSCVVAVVLSFEVGNMAGSFFLGAFFEVIDPDRFRVIVSGAVVYSLLVGAFAAIQYLARTRAGAQSVQLVFDARESAFCAEYGLSPRERDVLLLLVKGRTASVISEKLFISVETVRVHVKNIYRKVEVHSQQELIDRFEGCLAEKRSL